MQMEKVGEFRDGVSQTVTIPMNNIEITCRARVRMNARDEEEEEDEPTKERGGGEPEGRTVRCWTSGIVQHPG